MRLPMRVMRGEDNRDKPVTWHSAMRPGKSRALPDTPWGAVMDRLEHVKARIPAKGEHAFRVVAQPRRCATADEPRLAYDASTSVQG